MNISCGKTSGEELYCKGAKAFDYGRAKFKNAYVLDLIEGLEEPMNDIAEKEE